MRGNRYDQYCALARALDVVGDRWSLLIVRELWPGPRRFTDLVEGLPGISRKLLADRLRGLEHSGIVGRSELPPPAARQVYELSEEGRDLAAAISPLIAWGARLMGQRRTGEALHPRWSAVGMAALANREAARGVSETYQYFVDDYAFHFIVHDGSIEVHDGQVEDPNVVVKTDGETWADVAGGKTSASAAVAAGAITVTGDGQAAKRLGRIFDRERMLANAGSRKA